MVRVLTSNSKVSSANSEIWKYKILFILEGNGKPSKLKFA